MEKDRSIPHESGVLHVTGEAVYIDDIPVHDQLAHGRVVTSPHAHAKIQTFDLKAARNLPGVFAVLSHEDLPAKNDMGPIVHDEPILAAGAVHFVGQAVFLIAAENETIARKAEKLIEIEYELLTPILTIEEAEAADNLLAPERRISAGDAESAMKTAVHTIEGTLHTGAQEHWYLETQACLCIPGEGDEIIAYSGTQHPSETQALIAEALGITKNEVVVEVRRMGGAFGGKETQGNHIAVWAALLCKVTRRPVKIRLFRDDDQKMTGKRHPYLIRYKAGFDTKGTITAIQAVLNADAGATTDLSMAVLERAMMHAENSYFIPDIEIIGRAWKTNLPSNTAFRGFGGPQGVAGMETIIDRIARFLGKDAAEVRYANFYQGDTRNLTPYGQQVENNRLEMIWSQLMDSSEYKIRRAAIEAFNHENEFFKKGIAITPIKFGISFTTSFLNQAGALVHIYKDGTLQVNHGGTEMGQGLHTKIRSIAALELGISPTIIKVTATNTSKVPNTSATAASAGTDLNGMAVKNGIGKLKQRISTEIAKKFASESETEVSSGQIEFEEGKVFNLANPSQSLSFTEAVLHCYFQQVSLSATGFYRTPDVHFDREKGKGKPYHYFAFGMSVTEVLVDTLTGYHKILRADILHDVGESINPRLDIGQVEGGYIQGVGWCTTEECKWDDEGNLLNHSPDTYKIPGVQDIPADFRVKLLQGAPNPGTIRRSKAVAEPPFMLSMSCWLAIKDAISAVGDHRYEPVFSLPATHEVILLSIEGLKGEMSKTEVTIQ